MDSANGTLIAFGDRSLLGYQVRQAVAAGADEILIVVDAPTPDLAHLVDQASDENGVPVSLARDHAALARALTLDDRLLWMAPGVVAPQELVESLCAQDATLALLTLPAVPATSQFERIDGAQMWGGIGLAPAALVLSTLDMLGEWDLQLTLLRKAVQQGAERIELSSQLVMDGRLALVNNQRDADLAVAVLARQAIQEGRQGGLLSRLLAPLARPLIGELVRRQVHLGNLVWVGLALIGGGFALGVGQWAILALLAALAGHGILELADRAGQVVRRPAILDWQHVLANAGSLALLALLGGRLAQGNLLGLVGAWLPLGLIALQIAVQARQRGEPGGASWLTLSSPGAMILILIGDLAGWPLAGFLLLGLLSFTLTALKMLGRPPNRI